LVVYETKPIVLIAEAVISSECRPRWRTDDDVLVSTTQRWVWRIGRRDWTVSNAV